MFWKKPRKDSQPALAAGTFSIGGTALATATPGSVATSGSAPVLDNQPIAGTANADLVQKRESNGRACCVVQKGRVLSGTFSFSTPVRIEGTIRGRLFSSSTVVVSEGATAEVEGTVWNLVSSGSIQGTSFTVNTAELRPGSTVDTRLVAKAISAEPGCVINGELLIGVP